MSPFSSLPPVSFQTYYCYFCNYYRVLLTFNFFLILCFFLIFYLLRHRFLFSFFLWGFNFSLHSSTWTLTRHHQCCCCCWFFFLYLTDFIFYVLPWIRGRSLLRPCDKLTGVKRLLRSFNLMLCTYIFFSISGGFCKKRALYCWSLVLFEFFSSLCWSPSLRSPSPPWLECLCRGATDARIFIFYFFVITEDPPVLLFLFYLFIFICN